MSQKWAELHPWPIIQTWQPKHCPTFKLIFSTSFKCNTTLLFFLLCIAENICPPPSNNPPLINFFLPLFLLGLNEMATRCGSDLFPLPWQRRDWNRFLGVQGFWLTHRAAALKAFYGKFPRLQVSATVPLNPLPWVQSLTLWPRFASFPKVAALCLNVCFTHCSFYWLGIEVETISPDLLQREY